jgi:hypothetical protein
MTSSSPGSLPRTEPFEQATRTLVLPWAVSAWGATAVSRYVFPLVRVGTFSDATVTTTERVGTVLSYAALLLGALLGIRTLLAIFIDPAVHIVRKLLLSTIAMLVVLCLARGAAMPLFTLASLASLGAGTVLALLAAGACASQPHTRAASLTVFGIALAATLRGFGWFALTASGDSASPATYARGMFLISCSHAMQVLAVMFAALWLGTRGNRLAKISIKVAFALSLLLTLVKAPVLGAIASEDLLPAASAGLARFVTWATLFSAAAYLVEGRGGSVVALGVAVALLSRGEVDMPLRLSFLAVASLVLFRASTNKRGLWDELLVKPAQKSV